MVELFETIKSIVRTVLRRPDLNLSEKTVAADVAGWNSYRMVEIILEIESRFDVQFETEDLDNVRNLGDMVTRVADKLRIARGSCLT